MTAPVDTRRSRRTWGDRLAVAAALGLLGFQVAAIVYARFDEGRYFCWAPHDVSWAFRMRGELDGKAVEHDVLVKRYRLTRFRVHEHAIEHVKREIRQYERTYGRDDGMEVLLEYRKNGGPVQEWRWPER
jgi:hypothetical protein